jgi:hypothetical protein
MKFVKPLVVVAALAAGLGMSACGTKNNNTTNYNLECDVPEDYITHDSDCGYTDNDNQWHYYSWTSPTETTYSPDNWQPPAGVVIEEDSDSSHKKKKHRGTPTKKSMPAVKSTPKVSATTKPKIAITPVTKTTTRKK